MSDLPPELEGFASLLDAQPQPVREVFQYCLCLMMIEAGKMRFVNTISGDVSPIIVFETTAGEIFSVACPPMSQEEEDEVIAVLREILKDEGML